MLKKRILERGKQDEIYPVLMTGPNSFILDGQEYTGKPQVAGKRFGDGERAYVGFAAVGRRQSVILAGATRQGTQRGSLHSITVDVISWLQSNKDSGQVPLGGKLPGYAYEPDPDSYSYRWALPTKYNTGDDVDNVERQFLAYGLGRWQPDAGDDLYVAAYPQRNSGGGHAICIGAWGVDDEHNLAWEANFGDNDGNPTQYDFRAQQFFADQLAKAATALPDLNSTPSRACTARSGSAHAQTDLDKLPWNASLHSFRAADPENPSTQIVFSYLCLPLTDGDTNITIDFWKMNQGDLTWTKGDGFPAADVPDGGSSEIPDILPTGTDQTGPLCWTPQNEVMAPVSGGLQDLIVPTYWLNVHWTVRGIKPDGTAGTRLASKTIEATDEPRILTNASFQTQVLTAPFPLTYEYTGTFDLPTSYKVYGGIEVKTAANSGYEKIPECPPIFMPPAGPNMQHLPKAQGLEARMAYAISKGWPSDTVTRPGGMVVDDEGTVWWCVLEPEPVRYYSSNTANIPGGQIYTSTDSGATATVYLWTVFQDGTECFAGTSSGHGWNVNSTVNPASGVNMSTDPESWASYDQTSPCGNTDGVRRFSYSMDDRGSRPVMRYQLNLGLGILWRTKLYGLKTDNSLIEHDISQLQDVEITASFGSSATGGPGSGLESFTVTESDVPTPDAVWQLLPIRRGKQRLMAILRDLHYQRDGDCQPAPVLEVRDLGASAAVLSTTRLGSQEFRNEDFTSESEEYSYKEGDLVWNPYHRGAPRMKACRRDDDSSPVILTIVAEAKVVDEESEIQSHRLCYASIRLDDPENPDLVERSRTQDADSVGEEPGEILGGDGPRWEDWDTLAPTSGHNVWIRESNFIEIVT